MHGGQGGEPLWTDYETVAASQTNQILGPNGAKGDVLAYLIIIPDTVAAGAVSITDGDGSAITVYVGGATTPLLELRPMIVEIGARCVNATTPGWKVTTGANVHVLAVGRFR